MMTDNNEKYVALRRQYPEFIYEAYHYEPSDEGLRVRFDFRMGNVVFHPTALVERRPFIDLAAQDIEWTVFNIGMIELISYWKCACPPTVRISCGTLTPEQVTFWRKQYWNGLGEFYYTNGIAENAEDFMQVVCTGAQTASPQPAQTPTTPSATVVPTQYLVPVGGGKDSVVTLELLRRAGMQVRPLIMNPRGATRECARVAGFDIDEVLVIRRSIDPTLLKLNEQGYLNGHTPFSAMLAFYTLLASQLSGVYNVALSNENSANESTVAGSYVNHQYSKSLEFEDDFRNYCANASLRDGVSVDASANNTLTHSHVSTFNYFSFLRPLSELQIAMLFSRFTPYHDVFRSCNVGSKQDIWCGHCAKCLFAYIILSPFIAPERLNTIFGKAMLDDMSMRTELLELLGLAPTKPFECVGTVDEVRQALAMTLKRWYKAGRRPALLDNLEILEALENPDNPDNLEKLELIGNLTPEERQILQTACTEKNN